MYAVVEFPPDQGGGLSIISTKWLTPRKHEVFWPPYKEQNQFIKCVKKSEDINTETWKLYTVERIFYETDDYDLAVKKLKKAEETSDIQTEEEGVKVTKRKCVRPMRYSESGSDEDERQLPAPPSIKKKKIFKASNEIPNSPCSSITSNSTVRSNPSSSSNNVEVKCSDESALKFILENIIEIKSQNKIILSKIDKLNKSEGKTILPADIPVKIPVSTLEEIELLHEFLKETNNSDSLIKYFLGFGGTNINTTTNRILKETLEDSVASSFNFYGRNGKLAFTHLKVCSIIIESVKIACGCKVSDVEGAIKIWLKHAPQRTKLDKKRRHSNE